MDADLSQGLQQQVRGAYEQGLPLHIRGSGSKDFYGRAINATLLDVAGHRGVVNYQPTELVITARAGTPLAEIEALLAAHGQMLAFEPPRFGGAGTIGGAIACGLSGPRRPYAGAARDFVLGCRLINGQGEILRFGGEVMKNVAGFDVARLMAGAFGTLGLLLEVSLKVLPRPEQQLTLAFALEQADAIGQMSRLSAQSLPLSAMQYSDGRLQLRLSGAESALRAAQTILGGEVVAEADRFWDESRDQSQRFFQADDPLWRLSLPPARPLPALPGDWLIEWGGAQRWLRSDGPAESIRLAASRAGGHASLFRGGDRSAEPLQPLAAAVMQLQQRIKRAFDPGGIFNPGLLYRDL